MWLRDAVVPWSTGIARQRLSWHKEESLVPSDSPLSWNRAGPRWLGTPPPFSIILRAERQSLGPIDQLSSRLFVLVLRASFFFQEVIVQRGIKKKKKKIKERGTRGYHGEISFESAVHPTDVEWLSLRRR